MTKAYLAARYSRRSELVEYAKLLRTLGWVIASRWLCSSYPIGDDGLSLELEPPERLRVARHDLDDVLWADIIIMFTEATRTNPSRGGCWVEYGAALASNKRIIVIGPAENVFCCLDQVERYERWTDFLDAEFPVEGTAL